MAKNVVNQSLKEKRCLLINIPYLIEIQTRTIHSFQTLQSGEYIKGSKITKT